MTSARPSVRSTALGGVWSVRWWRRCGRRTPPRGSTCWSGWRCRRRPARWCPSPSTRRSRCLRSRRCGPCRSHGGEGVVVGHRHRCVLAGLPVVAVPDTALTVPAPAPRLSCSVDAARVVRASGEAREGVIVGDRDRRVFRRLVVAAVAELSVAVPAPAPSFAGGVDTARVVLAGSQCAEGMPAQHGHGGVGAGLCSRCRRRAARIRPSPSTRRRPQCRSRRCVPRRH